jgi:MFS family permease
MVLAAFPIVSLTSDLALGPPIDRVGHKKFIVMGRTGCAIALAATAHTISALPIIVGRAVMGLFMPRIGALALAAIADYIPTQNRPRMTGYITTAASFAFVLVLSISIFLGGLVAWQLPRRTAPDRHSHQLDQDNPVG